MENNSGQFTSKRKRNTTRAERSLTYAEKLELLESILVILQDSTEIFYRMSDGDVEIKIKNAKIVENMILPNK